MKLKQLLEIHSDLVDKLIATKAGEQGEAERIQRAIEEIDVKIKETV